MSQSLHLPRGRQRLACDAGGPIRVAIVNNMPDAALQSTERQFCELISLATGEPAVCVTFFSLPGVSRGSIGRLHIEKHHSPIEYLWQGRFDGLIVTGTEPLAPGLRDEPYWPAMTRLVDWAAENTVSTIWSCLAVHAAVDHLDGIERYSLGSKLSGVFECVKAGNHLFIGGFPPRWCVPHSRHNGLPEDTLARHDYEILGRSHVAGVDIFIKKCKSLFLFLQGHLEYDPGALLREYRRDVARFLAGDNDHYPDIPRGYFRNDASETLVKFQEQALRTRDVAVLRDFPYAEVKRGLTAPWRTPAVQLYTSWLSCLASERSGDRGDLAPAYRLYREQNVGLALTEITPFAEIR